MVPLVTRVCFWPRHPVKLVIASSIARRWWRRSGCSVDGFFVEPELAAAAFVLVEPPERVCRLADLLQDHAIKPNSSRLAVAEQVLLGGGSLDRTMSLLCVWRAVPDGASRLARTLSALLEVKQSTEQQALHAELVWSGHKPAGSPLRGTPQVISEMLEAAQSHVVLMSYSVWLGHARIRAILNRLAAVRRRGARVTFVFDRNYDPIGTGSGHNYEQLQSRWPADAPRPDVYSWGDDDDRIAKLHAKMIIVDRRDLLVTSANLTGRGMSGNLELGIRLVGRPAEQAHDHVLKLITSGAFVREGSW